MSKEQEKKKGQYGGLLTTKTDAERVNSIADALPDAKPESQQAGKPESRNLDDLANQKTVTVGAKVYKTLANHWTVEAKRQRRSVSDVIRQALVEAFGLPDDFPAEAVKPENRKTVKTD